MRLIGVSSLFEEKYCQTFNLIAITLLYLICAICFFILLGRIVLFYFFTIISLRLTFVFFFFGLHCQRECNQTARICKDFMVIFEVINRNNKMIMMLRRENTSLLKYYNTFALCFLFFMD